MKQDDRNRQRPKRYYVSVTQEEHDQLAGHRDALSHTSHQGFAWDAMDRLATSIQGAMSSPNNQRCGECDEDRPGDARVEGGLKCGPCAYQGWEGGF